MNLKPWIQAARLRTLPLAFSCIIAGAAIAIQDDVFNPIIFILALLTTLLFQVLSNFANDYGDAVSGKDKDRIGEKRMVASGEISKEAMLKSIYLFSILSFIVALGLVMYSFENYVYVITFTLLGIAAIWAAIKYTVGKNPYGYSGLGDLFVFIFFGIVGVCGSRILYSTEVSYTIILPAIAIGLLSTAVLTLNNLRDVENDGKTGKNTLIVKMGFAQGKSYFASLIIVSQLAMIAYAILTHFENRQYLFLLASILLSGILKKVLNTNQPAQMDPFLKRTALATFAMAVLLLVAMLF